MSLIRTAFVGVFTVTSAAACVGGDYSLGRPSDYAGGGGSPGMGTGGTGSRRPNGGSATETGGTGGVDGTGGNAGDPGGTSGASTTTGGTGGSGVTGGTASSMGGSAGTSGGGNAGGDDGGPTCGDGVVEAPEVCDDENERSGDGCSASCRFEPVLVAGGDAFHCALSSGRTVKCWGVNNTGALGLGDTEFRGDEPDDMGENLDTVDLGSGVVPVAFGMGAFHACAIFEDGALKCWGNNGSGQLGVGDLEHRGDEPGEMGDALPFVPLGAGRRAERVVGGYHHTCALLDDGSVKCWGGNVGGQLGLGDTEFRGDDSGEMGDALPSVNLGTGRHALDIAAGFGHTCALLDDHSVKCWGYNSGMIGLGDQEDRGDEPGEMGDALPRVNLGTGRTVRSIGARFGHSCALLDDASIKCWGGGSDLGVGDIYGRGQLPTDMGDALPPVDLGTGRVATTLVVGGEANCAILDDASLKCWGSNGFGSLGLGDRAARGNGPNQMGDSLPTVDLGAGRQLLRVFASYDNVCALLDGGELKCWGYRYMHPTRVYEAVCYGDEPGEMGDNLPVVDLAF